MIFMIRMSAEKCTVYLAFINKVVITSHEPIIRCCRLCSVTGHGA